MSTKLLHSLTDEKTDMQKQLGCMNGIFQLFDRNKCLLGRRDCNHKRLLLGQNVNDGMEQDGTMEKTLMQRKNSKQVGKDKKIMVPVELSRASFSSSCSSSTFSSADCNKTAHSEPSSSCESSFPETTGLFLGVKQKSSSSQLSQQPIDLRDIVKDSMKREARGLSVKSTRKEEGGGNTLKHIDSPRPVQLQRQKSVQPKLTRHDGSLRVLAKHRSQPLAPRDAPRYSYDETETQDKKSAAKLKELPRLSLDSRERSIRSSASKSRSIHLSREVDRENRISSQILNQEPGSNKRSPTIVARLMGLEPIPDFITTDEGQMMKEYDTISRSSREFDESRKDRSSGSQSVSCKNPASPRFRKDNSVKKSSTSSSRFPLEEAPWRQTDSNQGSNKKALMSREASIKSPQTSSVYGEIGKRLTELEFKKSDKDLRALKQILEAIEKTRERLENKKEEQTPNFESHISKCSPYSSFDQVSKQRRQINNPESHVIKGSSSPRKYGFEIVAKKQATLIEKPAIPTERRTTKDITPKKNHLMSSSSLHQPSMERETNAQTLRSSRHPKAPQLMAGENTASVGRSFGSLSPILQRKKLSSLTPQSCDFRRAHKQSIKKPAESGSPTRKFKPKSTNSQHSDDTVSLQSESGISLASQTDTEVASTNHPKEITCLYQPKDRNEEDFTARFIEEGSIAKLATATLEQPSPVSVLDSTFYEEDFPSPVQKASTAFQDYDTLNLDEAKWNTAYIDHLPYGRRPNPSSKFNNRKPENIDHLVHKLQLVNSIQDEATTNRIESFCDNTNPDHRYIADILLAAGLLTDLGSSLTTIQLPPSGLSVNPNLFYVLEKAKGNTELADELQKKSARSKSTEKVRRKLVFDTVNEILARKSALAGSAEPWIFQNKMGEKSMSGAKLLRELYSKMDYQQATPVANLNYEDDVIRADMMTQPKTWADYSSELPGIVLDIERLIFKDLIGEVLSSGAAGLQVQPGRHCRQMFPK